MTWDLVETTIDQNNINNNISNSSNSTNNRE